MVPKPTCQLMIDLGQAQKTFRESSKSPFGILGSGFAYRLDGQDHLLCH